MADDLPNPGSSSPWVSSSGTAAHPYAPLGGGGPGDFKSPGALGSEGNDSGLLPHPLAPVARNDALSELDVQALQKAGIANGTPLQTAPKKTVVTVAISEATGSPITFTGKDYTALYKEVSDRATKHREAGSVSRSFATSTSDVDADGNVGKVTFTIVLTTVLPTWTTIDSQPKADQDKFNAWRASVVVHEKRHVDIYKTEFAKLKTQVVGPKDTDITTQADAVDDAAEAAQVAFDAVAATQPAPLAAPGGMTKVP
ncbi:MAG: DUF922 domain-containing protein [Acidobacteria bacterium]|nr:DUF922 domain-containing protein [Acidobacteriota bacterium]